MVCGSSDDNCQWLKFSAICNFQVEIVTKKYKISILNSCLCTGERVDGPYPYEHG
jgi:hypothetical protein